MLHQLQMLEQTILEVKSRYNIVATELANLRLKNHDDSTHQVSQLQASLNQSTQEIEGLLATINELSASKAHLEAQIVELTTQNQLLIKENQELNDKHAVALERTKALQEWLSKIDNQTI